MFMELGERGSIWSTEFKSEQCCTQAKDVLTSEWAEVRNLKSFHHIIMEWQNYAHNSGVDWRVPNSITIWACIRAQAHRGSSVPKRYYDARRWAQNSIELESCCDLERVKRSADPPSKHHQVPANHIVLTAWCVIAEFANANNHFVRAIMLFGDLLVIPVVSPKHLQASAFSFHKHMITGEVLKGKRRVRGRQKPFNWLPLLREW